MNSEECYLPVPSLSIKLCSLRTSQQRTLVEVRVSSGCSRRRSPAHRGSPMWVQSFMQRSHCYSKNNVSEPRRTLSSGMWYAWWRGTVRLRNVALAGTLWSLNKTLDPHWISMVCWGLSSALTILSSSPWLLRHLLTYTAISNQECMRWDCALYLWWP